MGHLLDNPIWHALTGPHATLALGRGRARHYPRDVAPFSAILEPTRAAYADLAADLPAGLEARLFRPAEEATPPGWETMISRPIVQMLAEAAPGGTGEADVKLPIRALGAGDAADMLALARVAEPGPFGLRTALLGGYVGVREPADGRLVAMAGERFRPPGYVELSAICVHPEARGRGLGAALTRHILRRAAARGEVPFLHVFPDNPAACLYARLGFRERARLWVLWRRPIGATVP
jgi:ribosomal protein S18 acetylase RimI-like enzyme